MLIPFLSILVISCGGSNATGKKMQHDTTTHQSLTTIQKEYYQQKIEPIYNNLLVNSGFNGGILVAKNGEIVFEDYRGVVNFKTKEIITANSQFHIASVSKTFTAMAVLKLMEEGKVNIEADVKTYLPTFPYNNITVKNLLSHRSGLPNYVHLMEGKITETLRKKNKRGRWVTYQRVVKDTKLKQGLINNEDVLNFFIERRPAVEALPNHRFQYCNTNFALLALIVERVTGIDFPTYMKQNIFDPLGMQNTYVFSINDTSKYTPSYKYNLVPYGIEKLDCVYGDKNIYSTPRDILIWDQALYNNKVVSQNTMQMAYTPYSNERAGTHNYGLGWRLLTLPSYTLPYHNGWWHGNNAVFTRLIKDTATIIVLGNRYNPKIYKAKELAAVFTTTTDSLQLDE
ncbi:MAG: serine hydrolase domain-containing protein [Chitinophagaceae bacterium]